MIYIIWFTVFTFGTHSGPVICQFLLEDSALNFIPREENYYIFPSSEIYCSLKHNNFTNIEDLTYETVCSSLRQVIIHPLFSLHIPDHSEIQRLISGNAGIATVRRYPKL